MNKDIFKVDLKGLANLLPQEGLGWIINELVQNAWDQDITECRVFIDHLPQYRNKIKIVVEDDDPEGFLDLAHSFTLFAKSYKMDKADKRGRFNLGEKLVIAYAIATGGSVKIESTKGGYFFNKDGRKAIRKKREKGSRIEVICRGSLVQFEDLISHTETLIPPTNYGTWFSHSREGMSDCTYQALERPVLVASAEDTLPTVIAGDDGALRRSRRKTVVNIFEPIGGDIPMIYEMGIPVVESGTPYHADIQQKVPLTMERDNVTPSYRAKIHTLILNATADRLTEEQATQTWVTTAMGEDNVSSEAVKQVLDTKYGKKRLVHDPNNPEASAVAIANGYKVIYGGNENSSTWGNIRSKSPISSASTRFETNNSVEFNSNGKDVSLPRSMWNIGMVDLAEFAQRVYWNLFNRSLSVSYLNDPRGYLACFSMHNLKFNYRSIGKRKISDWRNHKVYFLDLLIHEFAHREGDSHFSEKYWKATTKIGAQLALLLAREPELIKGGE